MHDKHATMLHLLNFDHERLAYRSAGRDDVAEFSGQVVQEAIAPRNQRSFPLFWTRILAATSAEEQIADANQVPFLRPSP